MIGEGYVCIIGGANMDIHGFPRGRFNYRDSNPGIVKSSPGGVGRNIGENLARMGIKVKLISALGNDERGIEILENAKIIGLDMEDTLIVEGGRTSTYLSILDDRGDMVAAVADMEIVEKLDIGFVKSKRHIIKDSRLCIIDTNIPREVIEYIVKENKDTVFFLDTVSCSKAEKVRDIIGSFHTIKPNRIEAGVLTGIEIKGRGDMEKAAKYLLNEGVKRVFISLGAEGVYYSDGQNSGLCAVPQIQVINATGAGDAFMAGLAYSHMMGWSIDYASKFSCAASLLALSHENTINPGITVEKILNKMVEVDCL